MKKSLTTKSNAAVIDPDEPRTQVNIRIPVSVRDAAKKAAVDSHLFDWEFYSKALTHYIAHMKKE